MPSSASSAPPLILINAASGRAGQSIRINQPDAETHIMDYLMQPPVLLFASMMFIFSATMIAVCVTDSRLR